MWDYGCVWNIYNVISNLDLYVQTCQSTTKELYTTVSWGTKVASCQIPNHAVIKKCLNIC